MSNFSRLVLFAAAVVPLACGGFSSGLPTNKKASDLSSAEQQKYCDALADFSERELGDRMVEYSCQLSGAFAGQMAEAFSPGSGRQACEDAVRTCREEEGDDESESNGDCFVPNGCDATVGELERCHAAQVAKIREVVEKNTASCDPASWGNTDENPFDFETPEDCKGLSKACLGG